MKRTKFTKTIRRTSKASLYVLLSLVFVFSSAPFARALTEADYPAQDIELYRKGRACGTGANTTTALTPEQKIAQTFIVGFDPGNTAGIAAAVAKYKLGGVFPVGGNDNSGLTKEFFDNLNTAAGTPLFIAVDDEGGLVTRFSPNTPSATDMGNLSEQDVEAKGAEMGKLLKDQGLNGDLAPVLDLSNSGGYFMTDTKRTWSNNPDVVASKAGAFAKGLSSSGIIPVYKHFPGLGNTKNNTDKGTNPAQSLDSLQNGIKPYRAIANQNNAAVMLSNDFVSDWEGGNTPVSINAQAVNYLRNDVKFTGTITTDDLSAMTKDSYGDKKISLTDAIVKALNAGVDMPLFIPPGDAIDSAVNDAIQAAKTGVPEATIDAAYNKSLTLRGLSVPTSTAGSSSSTQTTQNVTTCCTTSASSIALTGDNNIEKVLSFMMGHGFTLAQAAGFIGNMQQESGVNPKAVQPSTTTDNPNYQPVSGTGFGLVQWTFPERQDPLVALVAEKKKANPNASILDIEIQLEYVWTELNSDSFKAMTAKLKTETDPVEAAITIHGRKGANIRDSSDNFRGYEESGDTPQAVRDVRGGFAKKIYDQYADKASLTPANLAGATTGNCVATGNSAGGAGDFVFYRQGAEPWGPQDYAGAGSYGGNACGPTSVAEVVATFKDKSVTPLTTGEWMENQPGMPFNAADIPKALDHWGVKNENVFAYTSAPGDAEERILTALRGGNLVIVSGKGAKPFTSAGHFIVLRGVTADGQILIGDPAAPASDTDAYNQKPWDPSLIFGQYYSATIAMKS